MRAWLLIAGAVLAATPLAARTPVPLAISADPPRDGAHPARMEVLHVPSGGSTFNAVVYVAAGAGPHPTLIIMHGLPGNEKNLDLAQAVRRAGWNAVTFNYRGSWGSPGAFSFAGNIDDARAMLAYLRNPTNAAALQVDTRRIALAGHSMGGWVAARTAERDPNLAGTVLISAANMGGLRLGQARDAAFMAENMESLATTAQAMADEVRDKAAQLDWTAEAGALAAHPLLVLSSDDGLAPGTDALITLVRAAPGSRVTAIHVATDHGWSDHRIRLQSEVIRWITRLQPVPQ